MSTKLIDGAGQGTMVRSLASQMVAALRLERDTTRDRIDAPVAA